MSSWRDDAQDFVNCYLLEYEAQALLLEESVDLRKALREISRDKYPFSWKGGHAYKAWLAAIKWTKERVDDGLSPSEISRINWKTFNRTLNQKNKTTESNLDQLFLFGAV